MLQAESAASRSDCLTNPCETVPRLDRGFATDLVIALQSAKASNREIAIFIIDAGEVSTNSIRDVKSHELMVTYVEKRIESHLGGRGRVTRTPDRKFLVMVRDIVGVDEASAYGAELQVAVSGRHDSDFDSRLAMSITIGAALYPGAAENIDTLIMQANQALREAAYLGGDTCIVFDSKRRSDRRQSDRIKTPFLSANLKSAMEEGRIELYYQPKVDLVSGEPVGAEALVRMRDNHHKLLQPGEFLPLIQSKSMLLLDMYILEQAMRQSARWTNRGINLTVSVNISPAHFSSWAFVDQVEALLERVPECDPANLALEILESLAIADVRLAGEITARLRKRGIKFYLDDFGTGHSSAAYLKVLKIDAIKIDQLFARDFPHGPNSKQDKAIIQASIAVARAFDIEVIAEGIETADAAREIASMGCRIGQGFHFARPLPLAGFEAWLL
jgi:EAL domain-containing protein (putative c-di-GMP-specific phosphodiesterase class I)/GGDEF domain-containing protein